MHQEVGQMWVKVDMAWPSGWLGRRQHSVSSTQRARRLCSLWSCDNLWGEDDRRTKACVRSEMSAFEGQGQSLNDRAGTRTREAAGRG